MFMKKAHRIGIVGLGKIAQAEHLPAIYSNPDFELAFVVDRNVEIDLKIPVFKSLSDALKSGIAFDAISICTSPQVRYELYEQLLEQPCAILLEKPAAANYSLAKQIKQHALSRNQCLFAAWHSRFAACAHVAVEWARHHKIKFGEIIWCENPAKWHPGQEWIWREGGFGVFDPGMNALSLLTQIVPVPWSLTSAELEIPRNAETPSRAIFVLENDRTEVTARFEFHDHENESWTIRLMADDGSTMELLDGGAGLRLDGAPVDAGCSRGEYDRVYQRFSELIARKESDCDLQPLAIIEDVLSSAQVSRTVAVNR